MKILGISSFFHDSAAALIDGPNVVAAAEEERFTRVKHDNSFPINSIKFVLNMGNLSIHDIDYVVFYEKPILKLHRILFSNSKNIFKNFNSQFELLKSWDKNKISTRSFISKVLGINKKKIIFFEHHFSHAASAFYCSSYKSSDLYTSDAVGEWCTTTYGNTKNKELIRSGKVSFPDSIGLLYTAFTEFLGFEVNEGEYKVMGMAPYGKPIYQDKIDKLFKKKGLNFELDQSYFNFNIESGSNLTQKFIDEFGERREIGDSFYLENFSEDLLSEEIFDKKLINSKSQYFADIASSLQIYLENFTIENIKQIKKENGDENLCYAGGVAYNSAINSKIIRSKIYKNVFIQPAAGDSGGALGCALGSSYLLKEKNFNYQNTYLGKGYNHQEIKKCLDLNSIGYNYFEKDEDLNKEVSGLISNSMVIGWFQGRSEFGPRALGNRSILADPRHFKNKKIINSKIKFREIFRPFAPSTLDKYFNEYYKVNSNWKDCDPYRFMLSTVEVKNSMKLKLAAVTHVDGTARAQLVLKKDNEKFYNLIKSFGDLTGIYTLLNTSFNRKGEPIVNSPQEALNVFLWTDLDALVLGNYLIKK